MALINCYKFISSDFIINKRRNHSNFIGGFTARESNPFAVCNERNAMHSIFRRSGFSVRMVVEESGKCFVKGITDDDNDMFLSFLSL